jgi:hypothetical protein
VARLKQEHWSPRSVFMCRAQIVYGDEQTVSAMIEDRSLLGLGIRVPTLLPLGLPIRVCFRNEVLSAIVKRCVKDQPGFFIGVAFRPIHAAELYVICRSS